VSLLACLHDQNKSGFFGGPAFFQPFRAFWKLQIALIGWIKVGPLKRPLLFWSCKQAIFFIFALLFSYYESICVWMKRMNNIFTTVHSTEAVALLIIPLHYSIMGLITVVRRGSPYIYKTLNGFSTGSWTMHTVHCRSTAYCFWATTMLYRPTQFDLKSDKRRVAICPCNFTVSRFTWSLQSTFPSKLFPANLSLFTWSKQKWLFRRPAFFPANQLFENFLTAVIGWIIAGTPKKPLLFWSCKQAIYFLFSFWKLFNYLCNLFTWSKQMWLFGGPAFSQPLRAV